MTKQSKSFHLAFYKRLLLQQQTPFSLVTSLIFGLFGIGHSSFLQWFSRNSLNYLQADFKTLGHVIFRISVVVRVHESKKNNKSLRFVGFYVTLHNNGSSAAPSCGGLGSFRTPKKARPNNASPAEGCAQPLLLNARGRSFKQRSGKWNAPVCGEIIIRWCSHDCECILFDIKTRFQTIFILFGKQDWKLKKQ